MCISPSMTCCPTASSAWCWGCKTCRNFCPYSRQYRMSRCDGVTWGRAGTTTRAQATGAGSTLLHRRLSRQVSAEQCEAPLAPQPLPPHLGHLNIPWGASTPVHQWRQCVQKFAVLRGGGPSYCYSSIITTAYNTIQYCSNPCCCDL